MSELIEFYKEELVMLKQQLGDKAVALEKSEKVPILDIIRKCNDWYNW